MGTKTHGQLLYEAAQLHDTELTATWEDTTADCKFKHEVIAESFLRSIGAIA